MNIETINRRTWRSYLDRRYYRKSAGYINAGEQQLLDLAMSRAVKPRVLDIGVGGGRTTPLLKPHSASYLGIDYTEKMVEMARANHPDVSFVTMDARAMENLSDGEVDLAVFSYNGIDSVDGEGRLRIIREVSRVLRSGGQFAFSTFNRDWIGFGNNPIGPKVEFSGNPIRLAFRTIMHLVGKIRARRRRRYEERNGEHAIFLHHAHDYGILVYATTLTQLTDQLSSHGFSPELELFAPDGSIVSGQFPHDLECCHVLATKV